MIHGLGGTLGIVLVVVLSALALAGVAGFYDGRGTAWRAFWLALGTGSFVGALQIFELRYLPWVMLAYLALGATLWWRRSR